LKLSRNERRIGHIPVQPLLFVDIVAEWVIKLTVDQVRCKDESDDAPKEPDKFKEWK